MDSKNIINKVRKWLSPIITICGYGLMIFLSFRHIGKNENADWQHYVVYTCISAAIMVCVYLLWLPTGKSMAEQLDNVVNNNKIYNAKANDIIDKQLFKQLKEFCDTENINFVIQVKKDILSEWLLTMEDLNEFDYNKYRYKLNKANLSNETLNPNKYTKQQIKCLKTLKNRQIRYKKLTPQMITLKKDKIKSIAPVNLEHKTNIVKLVTKVLTSLGMGAVMTIITVKDGAALQDSFMQLLMWTFTIGMNIYASIQTGYTSVAVDRNNYILELIELCSKFFNFIENKNKNDIIGSE